jgi:hypothetical protein
MSIYNRRNAAVGYLTLKAMQRAVDRKRKRGRRGLRIAAYVGLGLVSAGVLAGVLAIALRHRSGDAAEAAFESDAETDAEIVGEYVTAPEPAPAT